jgi:hypothetical protein
MALAGARAAGAFAGSARVVAMRTGRVGLGNADDLGMIATRKRPLALAISIGWISLCEAGGDCQYAPAGSAVQARL